MQGTPSCPPARNPGAPGSERGGHPRVATGWGQGREEQVGTCPGDSTEQRPRSAHLEGPLRVTWMDAAHVNGEWTLATRKQGHDSNALRS